MDSRGSSTSERNRRLQFAERVSTLADYGLPLVVDERDSKWPYLSHVRIGLDVELVGRQPTAEPAVA